MKTQICITYLQLSIPKMFTCTVSVAARKTEAYRAGRVLVLSRVKKKFRNIIGEIMIFPLQHLHHELVQSY